MTTSELEKSLSQLGFPMLEATAGHVDVNKTLAEVVKSNNARYWEAFPVLLVNANKTGNFSVKEVEAYLAGEAERRKWRSLLKMSVALYPVMKRFFAFAQRMEKGLRVEEKKWVKDFRNKARTRVHDNFELENKMFSFSRLKTLLDNYMQEELLKAQKVQAQHVEHSLEFALSQVFSPRQKELFKKKLNGDVLSKTEREYFSRAVKKKALALANPELHRMAQKLLG